MKIRSLFILGLSLCALSSCNDKAKRIEELKQSADGIIQWSDTVQTIDGFGIAQAGWARELFTFSNRDEVMDMMFGQNGLRLNILRGEIFPHFWEGIDDKDFNLDEEITTMPTLENYSKKTNDLLRRGQIWISQQAKSKYHVDKQIYAAWSPPAWMKINGQITPDGQYATQGQLNPLHYQDFADYLADFYEAYASVGIPPYAISPSNEPGYPAPWNSCTWTADEMGKFIAQFLIPTFDKRNIPAHIIFGENPLWSTNYSLIDMASSLAFTNTVLKNYPDMNHDRLIAAGHGYLLTAELLPVKLTDEQMQTPIIPFDMAEKLNIPVWVTEISEVTALDTSMEDGLVWSKIIHDYFTMANINAFVWWAGAMPTTTNESLIILDKNGVDYKTAKRYDVMGNYSRYISEGSKRIEVTCKNDSTDLFISAYKKGQNFSIIATNPSNEVLTHKLFIEDLKSGDTIQCYTTDVNNTWAASELKVEEDNLCILKLPAFSVVTFTGVLKEHK